MVATRDQIQLFSKLKASQLHQFAVALGAACSGNKGTVIGGILHTLTSTASDGSQTSEQSATISLDRGQPVSIISIDMGIQNLAYAHLLAPPPSARRSRNVHASSITKLPILRAWERLSVFPVELQDNSVGESAKAGLYNPSRYAEAAYQLIRDMLTKYNPTHVLIEQQRFRSSGSSAVAEWTIRVGVFEGMLHAVLQTLRAENKEKFRLQTVTSINPARTAQFWLKGSRRIDTPLEPKKITGREGKQAKIDIVGKAFLDSKDRLVETATGRAKATERAFMNRWHATSKVARALRVKQRKNKGCTEDDAEDSGPKLAKLDDLADCLLQGMAWLEWQRMRQLVLQDLTSNDPMNAVQHRLDSLARTKVVQK
jgi:cruciform cutting endonuclease 1